MCRTLHALTSIGVCATQMVVRVFMTIFLMVENVIRLILQTFYNFLSFMLQMLSLIPICVVFLLTARLKCLLCGGGGQCPVNRSGATDCVMSTFAFILLFFIFRATGVLDKLFYSIGYSRAEPPLSPRIIQLPDDITEYSRNDTDYRDYKQTLIEQMVGNQMYDTTTDTEKNASAFYDSANLTMFSIVAANRYTGLNDNWTTMMYHLM